MVAVQSESHVRFPALSAPRLGRYPYYVPAVVPHHLASMLGRVSFLACGHPFPCSASSTHTGRGYSKHANSCPCPVSSGQTSRSQALVPIRPSPPLKLVGPFCVSEPSPLAPSVPPSGQLVQEEKEEEEEEEEEEVVRTTYDAGRWTQSALPGHARPRRAVFPLCLDACKRAGVRLSGSRTSFGYRGSTQPGLSGDRRNAKVGNCGPTRIAMSSRSTPTDPSHGIASRAPGEKVSQVRALDSSKSAWHKSCLSATAHACLCLTHARYPAHGSSFLRTSARGGFSQLFAGWNGSVRHCRYVVRYLGR